MLRFNSKKSQPTFKLNKFSDFFFTCSPLTTSINSSYLQLIHLLHIKFKRVSVCCRSKLTDAFSHLSRRI